MQRDILGDRIKVEKSFHLILLSITNKKLPYDKAYQPSRLYGTDNPVHRQEHNKGADRSTTCRKDMWLVLTNGQAEAMLTE